MLTLKNVKAELRKYNVVIEKRDDEYRVNVARGAESTAYYTNDLSDALGTGIAMGTHVTTQH